MIKIFIYFILINTLVFAFASADTAEKGSASSEEGKTEESTSQTPYGETNTEEGTPQAPSEEPSTEDGTPQDSSQADADDDYSKELEEQLYNLEMDINGEDDLIQTQAVEEAGSIVIDTEDEDFAWRVLYIVELGLSKSEQVQKESVSQLGKIVQKIQDPKLRDKALSSLEGHSQYASEDIFMEITQAAERIVKSVENDEIAQRAFSLVTQGYYEESDLVQRQTLKSLAKIAKEDPESDRALQALDIIENARMIQSEMIKETLFYYVPRQLAFVDNPEIEDRVLSLLEWGMFPTQSENIQNLTVRRACRIFEIAEGETRDRVYAILQQGVAHQIQSVRDQTIEEINFALEDTEDEESKQMLVALLSQEPIPSDEDDSSDN